MATFWNKYLRPPLVVSATLSVTVATSAVAAPGLDGDRSEVSTSTPAGQVSPTADVPDLEESEPTYIDGADYPDDMAENDDFSENADGSDPHEDNLDRVDVPQAEEDAEAALGLPGQRGCIHISGVRNSICLVNKVDDQITTRIRRWLPRSAAGRAILNDPRSYDSNGNLVNTHLGHLCEAAGGQVLRIYGHKVQPYRVLTYEGRKRRFDQITTKIVNGAQRKFYWEGKANGSPRSPREKKIDTRLISKGFAVHDYWCGVDRKTGRLGNMYIGDDRL